MLEINRVLKQQGKFFLSVYYNSNFIDCCETTIIDDDFVKNHLKNIFNVEWIEVVSAEAVSAPQVPIFSLPEKRERNGCVRYARKMKITNFMTLKHWKNMDSLPQISMLHSITMKNKLWRGFRFFLKSFKSKALLRI